MKQNDALQEENEELQDSQMYHLIQIIQLLKQIIREDDIKNNIQIIANTIEEVVKIIQRWKMSRMINGVIDNNNSLIEIDLENRMMVI